MFQCVNIINIKKEIVKWNFNLKKKTKPKQKTTNKNKKGIFSYNIQLHVALFKKSFLPKVMGIRIILNQILAINERIAG